MRTIKQHICGIDAHMIFYKNALSIGYFLGNIHINDSSPFSTFFRKSHTRGTQIMRIFTNVSCT